MAALAYAQRSPTLSDAGMILPAVDDTDCIRAFSPEPYLDRPPSPPVLFATAAYVKLHSAPHARRRIDLDAPSPSAHSSRSTLHSMPGSDAARNDTLASSPTLHDPLSRESPSNWAKHDHHRPSTASSSSLAGDLNSWPGFDSHGAFDDSGVDLEEQQERRNSGSSDAITGEDIENQPWSHGPSGGSGSGSGSGSDDVDGDDDDEDGPYSSAALSRRAEIILANAKKRLNVCLIVPHGKSKT